MVKEARKKQVSPKTKRLVLPSSSSESDTSVIIEPDNDVSEDEDQEVLTFGLKEKPRPDDYILVEFQGKKVVFIILLRHYK